MPRIIRTTATAKRGRGHQLLSHTTEIFLYEIKPRSVLPHESFPGLRSHMRSSSSGLALGPLAAAALIAWPVGVAANWGDWHTRGSRGKVRLRVAYRCIRLFHNARYQGIANRVPQQVP